ncbi:pyridoxal phosphate-dependent transferase [Penicillium angulare]|uniref:Pyridoxal phosphate-dependent transferase n=1 Tax=Penicillium angulare TaxID=116970 RepID=A0A9W9F461_9EURO|nr:pyridoxal phosphate-dependent transferase [Penicillium angulare]
MGDIGAISQPCRRMPPITPQALPLGKANMFPSHDPHYLISGDQSVSVSLPTWESVIGLSRKEDWVMEKLACSYPRFYLNKEVRDLADAVLQRLQINDKNITCMMFNSPKAGEECASLLQADSVEKGLRLEVARFFIPAESNITKFSGVHWANFSAVIFHNDLKKTAMGYWRDTGAGISTRHASFCLEEFDYLDSDSVNPALRTPAPRKRNSHRGLPEYATWMQNAPANQKRLQSFIAQLATSEHPGQSAVTPEDVFLYPNGMNAIYSLSESLASLQTDSQVVAYGWLYPETVEVLRRGAWKNILSFKDGTETDLDQLENMLQFGQQIHALFCELPSNIKLSSPNLRRIRALADEYNFIVACDDTVVGYVNIDALPYVDVMMSSLTKTFSGSSNVTGGSLVINPNSRHSVRIQAALSSNYGNNYFPLDLDTLLHNCQDIAWRVRKCNQNTLPLVDLFAKHPSIAQVNHPSIDPTAHLYKSLIRKDGGYGNVLSIIFHYPSSAEHFYNILGICKGSSFGTNFTLAIPYVQLANYWNRDKVPKYGVPQHIIRISVGMEDILELTQTISKALDEVMKLESKSA